MAKRRTRTSRPRTSRASRAHRPTVKDSHHKTEAGLATKQSVAYAFQGEMPPTPYEHRTFAPVQAKRGVFDIATDMLRGYNLTPMQAGGIVLGSALVAFFFTRFFAAPSTTA